jgi:esterase/lipase superfamily enzyme
MHHSHFLERVEDRAMIGALPDRRARMSFEKRITTGLLAAAIIAFVMTASRAQQPTVADSRNASFACQDAGTDPQERVRLTKTIADLTETVSRLRSEARTASDFPPQSAAAEEAAIARQQRLLDTEAQLSVALSREDCFTSLELPSEKHRGPGDPPARYVKIPVFYLTERQRSGTPDLKSFYGAELRKSGLESGTINVLLASKLRFDDPPRARPKSWTDAQKPADSVDFAVEAPQPLAEVSDADNFLPDLLKQGGSKKLLVFVHGFNVSFVEAVVRGVQLAHDLEFDGDLLVYSWASMGAVLSYGRDEDTARISAHHMRAILQELDGLQKYDTVYLVAHSMGTRILADALRGLTESPFQGATIKEVVLAAPDINTLEYRSFLEPKILERFRFRTTIYVSMNDFALKVSRRIHEYPRLGDPSYERYVQKGIDVVDTSASSPMRRSWGHSYIWDNPLVTNDFKNLINLGRGADARGLKPTSVNGSPGYWVLD